MSVNNDNFLIEEDDIVVARKICENISDESVRNRSVANVLVAELTKKYFVEESPDIESGIYHFDSILQGFDISDIYLRENYIDVRLYFNDNELSIPKRHFELDVLPLAYMFVKVDEELSNATVQGFAFPADINCEIESDGYYFINETDLVSFYDLQNRLTSPEFVEIPDDFNKMIYDYLDGRNIDLSLFYNILTRSLDARKIFANIAKSYSIMKFISINPNATVEVDSISENNLSETDLDSEFEILSDEVVLNNAIDDELIDDVETIDFDVEDISIQDDLQLYEAGESELDFGLQEKTDEISQNEDFSGNDFVLNESTDESSLELPLEDENTPEDVLDLVDIENDANVADAELSEESLVDVENAIDTDFQEVEQSTHEYTEESISAIYDENNIQENLTDLMNNEFSTYEEVSDLNEEIADEVITDTTEILENKIEETDDFDDIASYNYATEISPTLKVIEDETSEDAANDIENTDEKMISDDKTENQEYLSEQAHEDEEQIDVLFKNDSSDEEISDEVAADDISENDEIIIPKKKKSMALPLLGALLVVGALGYHMYSKNAVSSIPENVEPVKTELQSEIPVELPDVQALAKKDEVAMPIETVENVPVLNPSVKNEAVSVSIPTIEKNLDASVVVANLSVNWEVPAGYATSNTAKRYFMKIGKVLQLNLKTEMLLMDKPPITNKIEVELSYDQSSKKFVIKDIITSSGEISVDELIKRTVRGVLDLNLNMNMSTFSTLQGNPILVIKL